MRAVETQHELGQRIRQARLARDLDQTTLASSAGLDRTAISKVEAGSRKVSALELTRIAAALTLTVPDLVYTPPEGALSARASLTEPASRQETNRFDAEVALDALLRDAEQLRALGHLPQGQQIDAVRWGGHDDAHALARQVRDVLHLGLAPLDALADVCARWGLWIAQVDAAVDGLSMTPEATFGVAVIGSQVEPGRRRVTAAHELGHHLSGDAYSSDISVSASTDDRERLIDAFACELLLPESVCRSRLDGLGGETARQELIKICAEYRVSWSVAVRTVERAQGTKGLGDTPTDGDFLVVCGAKPIADLAHGTMASAWVKACMAALRSHQITARRAAEMMRTGADIDGLR